MTSKFNQVLNQCCSMHFIKSKLKGILYPPGVNVIDPKIATALFLILFSTQLTLTTPFSYLPAMVKSFGFADKDRGYYFGMIASSLFVGRFFGGYFWGWLTDKYGRRPVLLISSTLTLVATLAFGFTTNIYWALATRFLQGLFNGVIVCGRAAFAEVCDDTNQAIGVSLVFAAWNSAIVLGPALGGFLADPVAKYPNLFSGALRDAFTQFAYVLPSILISVILLLSIIMIYFVFPETHNVNRVEDEVVLVDSTEESKSEKQNEKKALIINGDHNDFKYHSITETDIKFSNKRSSCCHSCCASIKEMSLYQLCSDKYVVLVTIMFGISGFCIIGFSELRSLWMATSNELGGLEFTTDKIGIALLVPALIAVILQPIIFGRLERKVGGIWTLRITLIFLSICSALYPIAYIGHKSTEFLWTFLILVGVVRLISDISSRSAIALFINNVVYKEQAGRVNGLAFSVQEIMRVASPTLMGSLFAWSINEDKHKVFFPINYCLSFFALALFLCTILILSIWLPKRVNAPKESADKQKNGPNSSKESSSDTAI